MTATIRTLASVVSRRRSGDGSGSGAEGDGGDGWDDGEELTWRAAVYVGKSLVTRSF